MRINWRMIVGFIGLFYALYLFVTSIISVYMVGIVSSIIVGGCFGFLLLTGLQQGQ